MTAARPKPIVLLLTLLHFALTTFGAGPTSQPTNALDQALMQPPSIQPADPQPSSQPQQPSDRKGGAGAAQAMAIAGAAIAGMSCMMMMNEARKMPPGPEKNMMMMQAMQQCAQAAQNAANAAKNDDAKKAVSQNDTPKMATLVPAKGIQESKGAENPALPTAEEKKEETTSTPEIAEPGPLTTPSLEEPKIVDSGFAGDPGFAANGVSISALKPIEASRVDFNEGNKNDTPTITPPGMGGNGFFGGGKPLSADDLKKLSGADTVATKEGRGGKAEAEEPLSSDLGSGSSKEEGNSAFDQLLNQLMGGTPPPDTLGVGNSSDLVALPRDKSTGKGPNIFEYASYRYRVATYDESRITVRKPTASRELTFSQSPTVALKND